MKCFDNRCQGESHKDSGKECQDYSLSKKYEERGITIAVVCDGHGGDRYFRSATGARLAAEIAEKQICRFLEDVDPKLFVGRQFVAYKTQDEESSSDELNTAMRRLFRSISVQWRNAIEEDGFREPTDWEVEHVEKKYLDQLNDEQYIAKAYGCTLMAYVCTKEYWFAFHLGDGKMVMLDSEFNFSQPVPWDERCFLNKTTSLCETSPDTDFRFCVQGDGQFPVAMFLGSDGLDDSYGDGFELNSFYGDILKELSSNDQSAVNEMLGETLPQISKWGSKDDMSVAVVYDENKIEDAAIAINEYQKRMLKDEVDKLRQEQEKKETFIRQKESSQSEKDKIEVRMAKKELVREQQSIIDLEEKIKKLYEFPLLSDSKE